MWSDEIRWEFDKILNLWGWKLQHVEVFTWGSRSKHVYTLVQNPVIPSVGLILFHQRWRLVSIFNMVAVIIWIFRYSVFYLVPISRKNLVEIKDDIQRYVLYDQKYKWFCFYLIISFVVSMAIKLTITEACWPPLAGHNNICYVTLQKWNWTIWDNTVGYNMIPSNISIIS